MRRAGLVVVVLFVSFTLGQLAAFGQEPESSDLGDAEVVAEQPVGDSERCDGFPPVARQVCGGIGGALTNAFQPVVYGGVQLVMQETVTFVVDGAAWLLNQVASFIDSSTSPRLTSSWFERAYRDMSAVAVVGLLPFLLLAIVQGIIRQDMALVLRAVFGYVPLAAIGTAAAVVVVDLLVELTDLLSWWVGRSFGSDLGGFATDLGESLASLPAGTGYAVTPLAALLAAGVIAFAAFVIWLELLLRQAAIYVAVLFLPLGFMAMVWPATAHWLRRLVQGLVAIILSKFVIVAVLGLAAAALRDQANEGGFPVVIAGASLLAMAALAPYVLLRLIPVFEAGFSGELEGTYRRPTAAVQSPATGHSVVHMLRSRGGGGGGPSAGPAGAGGAGPRASTGSTAAAPVGAGAGGASAARAGGAGGASGAGARGGSAGAGAVATAGAVVATTVASGARGAKSARDRLQASGDQQYAATVERQPVSGEAPGPRSGPPTQRTEDRPRTVQPPPSNGGSTRGNTKPGTP